MITEGFGYIWIYFIRAVERKACTFYLYIVFYIGISFRDQTHELLHNMYNRRDILGCSVPAYRVD